MTVFLPLSRGRMWMSSILFSFSKASRTCSCVVSVSYSLSSKIEFLVFRISLSCSQDCGGGFQLVPTIFCSQPLLALGLSGTLLSPKKISVLSFRCHYLASLSRVVFSFLCSFAKIKLSPSESTSTWVSVKIWSV